MMETCRNCIHWERTGPKPPEGAYLRPYAECDPGPFICGLTHSKYGDPESYGSEALAFGFSYEQPAGWRQCALWTKADFGCNQFVAMPVPPVYQLVTE